jgi:tetratricopeptide (TPR) repeat protein
VVLAVITTIATIGLLTRPRPSAVLQPAAPVPSATPLPPAPPAEATPDVANRLAAADRPVATKDAASATGSSRAATGPAKAGGRSHAKRRAHHQKRRAAHASRNKHRHPREIALESAPAPKAAGDESSARRSYERGNQRLLTGDTAGAISAYEEAVQAAPSSPSGYRGLGLAYEKAGKLGEAVRAFRHYLKLAPSSDDRDLVARRLRHLARAGDASSK